MKFVKLATLDIAGIHNLGNIESLSGVYYYDSEAGRQIIITRRQFVELIFGIKLDKDFVDETTNVFVVVTEEAIYAVATKDVSPYFDQLIAKLEVAEMAETDKC